MAIPVCRRSSDQSSNLQGLTGVISETMVDNYTQQYPNSLFLYVYSMDWLQKKTVIVLGLLGEQKFVSQHSPKNSNSEMLYEYRQESNFTNLLLLIFSQTSEENYTFTPLYLSRFKGKKPLDC